jgi:hypothetical protein
MVDIIRSFRRFWAEAVAFAALPGRPGSYGPARRYAANAGPSSAPERSCAPPAVVVQGRSKGRRYHTCGPGPS